MINFVGKTIEHYQILAKVRETPTRVLYKVYNAKSHSYNALEVVKTSWLEPAELLNLLNDQVHKNADLTHPNIANVTDIGMACPRRIFDTRHATDPPRVDQTPFPNHTPPFGPAFGSPPQHPHHPDT